MMASGTHAPDPRYGFAFTEAALRAMPRTTYYAATSAMRRHRKRLHAFPLTFPDSGLGIPAAFRQAETIELNLIMLDAAIAAERDLRAFGAIRFFKDADRQCRYIGHERAQLERP